MLQRRAIFQLSLALGLCVSGCLSPTLPPLPPPAQPSLIRSMGDGEVLVEGNMPVAEAKLLMLNRQTEQIYGVFAHDGSYSVLIRAEEGDRIDLWYSSLGVDSPVIGFNIGAVSEVAPAADAGPADAAAADAGPPDTGR
jgi:hypothetical protein